MLLNISARLRILLILRREKGFGAGKGTRTLDPNLGKVVLYQLSYSRCDFKARYSTVRQFCVKSILRHGCSLWATRPECK